MDSTTSSMKAAPSLSSSGSNRVAEDNRFSDSPHIEKQVNRVMNEETIEIRVPAHGVDGCTEVYQVNPDGNKGAFSSSDMGISASIQTSSGQMVYAGDEGSQKDHVLKDGITYSSWVHPKDENGNSVSESLTRDEMKTLEAADGVAYDHGFISSVDPEMELTEEERVNATLTGMEAYKKHMN